MSYNGAGTFTINTAGQPVVAGTAITATAFNTLTADLATGLSTAMCRDGQSTATGNLPMGGFKLTGLGPGTSATDAVNLGQMQGMSASLVTVAGTDTLTGTMAPALTSYVTGELLWFVPANTNAAAVTINIDGLGAKSIVRGSTALAAADLIAGSAALILYDGTNFQLLSFARSIQTSGTIASAATVNVGTANAECLTVSGTTTITSLGTAPAGVFRALVFSGVLTLTHNGTSLILPTAANIVTAAGDVAGFRSLGSGNWRCEWYTRASGAPLTTPASTLTGQVAVTNGGTGASTLTANNVLLGNGTGAVQFVAPGASANVLVSNGTTWTSAAAPQRLVQQIYSSSTALASGTTITPLDDTIPQNTEGTEFLTATITPTSAANALLIEVCVLITSAAGGNVIGAIHQDSAANALAAADIRAGGNDPSMLVMRHRLTAGTTSATTFRFRAGPATATTIYLNGNSAGTRLFGGVSSSTMTITEIAP